MAGGEVGIAVEPSAVEPSAVAGTVGASSAPLISTAAPLLDQTEPDRGSLQREFDTGSAGPSLGLPLQRTRHAGGEPPAVIPPGPSPVVARREQAPVGQPAAVPGSVPLAAADPVSISSAMTDRLLLDGDIRNADSDWASLPESGGSVGPVGSRPLQRSLAEASAPAVRVSEPAWPGTDLAGSSPVPRSDSAFTGTAAGRVGHVDMSLSVSRRAAVTGSASPLPGPPSPARRAFGHAAAGPGTADLSAPLTLQALVATDDVPPQAAVHPSSEPVVERAATSADMAGGIPLADFASPTLSRAVPEPPGAEAGAATAVGAAAAAGPAAAPAAAPADVDALVRRLYDPLAQRLRAELRLDRERIGRSLDLRH
jgi:hypothetical protein